MERKRVFRLHGRVDLHERIVIGEKGDAIPNRHPKVVIAFRAQKKAAREILVDKDLTAFWTFLPEIGRNVRFIATGKA